MSYFLPFLLVLLIVAALLRNEFFFTVAYFFLGLYVLARLWIRQTTTRLDASRRFTERAFSGDQVTVDLVIENQSRLPIPWLEIHESLPVQLSTPPFHQTVVSVAGRRTHRVRYTLNCRQRGYYSIGPLTLELGDLLGLTKRSQIQVEPQHLIVYPRVLPLEKLKLPTHSPLVALPARTPLFEDPARLMGVREYQRGDSPRRIHWTATANAGRLLVKRYEPAIARETLITLNLNQADYQQRRRYTATELAITVAASLANHIIVNEKLPVGLSTEAWDPLADQVARFHLPPRKERAHLMHILEILARVDVAETITLADLLRRESVSLPWGATIAVISSSLNERLLNTLVHLRQSGFAVTLVLIQPTHEAQTLFDRADVLGIPLHRVCQEEDARIWP